MTPSTRLRVRGAGSDVLHILWQIQLAVRRGNYIKHPFLVCFRRDLSTSPYGIKLQLPFFVLLRKCLQNKLVFYGTKKIQRVTLAYFRGIWKD